MRKKLKNLSYTGLAVIAAVFAFAVVMAFFSPRDAGAALGTTGAMSLMFFGMATGIVQDSITNTRTCKYTHTAALVPGDPLLVNGSLAIATKTTAANVENVFVYHGKVNLPKTAALAVNVLDAVYWDNTNSEVNKTASGNTACGYCVEDAAGSDTTVTIMLQPSVA